MDKKRATTEIIALRVSVRLKDRIDTYCQSHGLGIAELIRCYIMGLPDETGESDIEADLTAMIDKLTRRRDALAAAAGRKRGEGGETP